MGKASYTDRKLTDAERSVAQKYYYLVSYFIWKKHLTPMTEWEGELAIPYMQAIKKYSDYDQLHCFSIKTVIFYALDSARANYFKKRNCAKRKAAGGEVYYDEKGKQGAYISDYRISGNPMITEQVALSNAMVEIILENMEIERQYQREVDRFSKPEKGISLKIQTIKYCGTETGKILALFSQISYDTNKRGNIPKFAMVYVTCLLLSVMKREVLGQIIDPRTILKVLLVDYEEMADTVNEAAAYVEERRSELYLKEIEE